MPLTLIIGNKNYSSWSLRPWLLLKQAGILFDEILVPLYEGDYKAELLKYSPNGKVPTLLHDGRAVWESLAIVEYVHELHPEKNLWPQDIKQRAWARTISAEMHSGFSALRNSMHMNLRKSLHGKGRTPEVEKDIQRIFEIWEECRKEFKTSGPFLFGHFTIADAMFAPVVTRFKTYGVELSPMLKGYSETILNLPAMKEWYADSLKEPWTIPAAEV